MKKHIVFVLLFLSYHLISGQILTHSGEMIKAGLEDGPKLVNAYLTPLNKVIIFGLSDVSYSRPKKNSSTRLLLSAKMAYVIVPEKDLTFDVTQIGLTHFVPENPHEVMAQTILGDSLRHITLVSKEKNLMGKPLIKFKTPGGKQYPSMLLPFLGITYRFSSANLIFNFIPYVPLPTTGMKVGMAGIYYQQDMSGIIHSLKGKRLGMSMQIGGAFFYGHSHLEVKPGGISTPVTITGNATGPYDNQNLNAYYMSLYAGMYLDYSLGEKFTLFVGSGTNYGYSRIMLTGRYPIYISDPMGFGSVVAKDVDDPLDITGNYFRYKIEAGGRLEFEKFYLQLVYNAGPYGGGGLSLGYIFY